MASAENTAVNELIARTSAGQTTRAASPVPPLHPLSTRPEGTPTATPSPFGGLNERNPFLMTFPASMPVAAPFEQTYPLASRELIEAYAPPPLPPPPMPVMPPAMPGTMVSPQALPLAVPSKLPPSLKTFDGPERPMGYPVQPVSYPQPTVGYPEPPVVHQEPSSYPAQPAGYAEQPIAYAQPSALYQEPSVVYQEPSTGYAEQPIAYAEQPAGDVDQTVAWPSVEPAKRRPDTAFKTLRLGRRSHLKLVVSKLVVPSIVLIVLGLGVGGYAAIAGRTSQPAKPAAVAQLAAAKPAVASPLAATKQTAVSQLAAAKPAAATPPAPAQPTMAAASAALINIRIQSTPSGATVSLIDRGKPQLVGNTPIDVAVDPSRSYDLAISDPNDPEQPGRVQHFDPRTTRQLDIALDDQANDRVDPPAAEPPAHHTAPHHAIAKHDRPHAEPAQAGEGQLMISSKPPCEIFIDGNPTGLSTPQRSIPLAAGRHKVTLVNREAEIKKTLTVHITADATEKRIEDLMSK